MLLLKRKRYILNFSTNVKKLQVDNPDQLIYENEILRLTVLGGIKLSLDGMRALQSTITTKQ